MVLFPLQLSTFRAESADSLILKLFFEKEYYFDNLPNFIGLLERTGI